MERIKQAIENVKPKDPNAAGQHDSENTKEKGLISGGFGYVFCKRVVAMMLLIVAGGTWIRLDCLNEQEKGASEHISEGIQLARVEAKRRMLTETRFGYFIRDNLTSCQDAAEKAKKSYVKLVNDANLRAVREALPHRQDKCYIPPAVAIDPEVVLMNAKADCQKIYDAQFKNGQY